MMMMNDDDVVVDGGNGYDYGVVDIVLIHYYC